MALYKRGNVWWSNFTVNGKRVQSSTGCNEKKKAAEWEKNKISSLAGEENAKIALEKVKRALVDNNLPLSEAWGVFEQYPRAKTPNPKLMAQYSRVVADFVAFAANQQIKLVSAVTDMQAAAYVTHIRQQGRFAGYSYRRGKKQISVDVIKPMAPNTINLYIGTLKLFFDVMVKTKHILENPFMAIEKVAKKEIPREIFNESEIDLLLAQQDHPLYPIIVIGLHTGLRLGDIVRLGSADIDWAAGFIRRDQHKTNVHVDIPMLPVVSSFLRRQCSSGAFFPQLLHTYASRQDLISKDFKTLLDQIGISGATVDVPGRSRKQSVKDIHSLRHTFAYIAGKYHIPLAVVQSILGHMTPAMTRHYMAHANDADKVAAMEAFPDLLKRSATKLPVAVRVGRLIARITPDNLAAAKRRIGKILGGMQ